MLKYFIKIAASSAESLSSCHIWDEVAVMRDLLEGRVHTSIRRYSVVGVVSARFRRLTHSLTPLLLPSLPTLHASRWERTSRLFMHSDKEVI